MFKFGGVWLTIYLFVDLFEMCRVEFSSICFIAWVDSSRTSTVTMTEQTGDICITCVMLLIKDIVISVYSVHIVSCLLWSASSLWHRQWKCSILQRSCGLHHRKTNSRSHPQAHLWQTGRGHWIAAQVCQTVQCSSAGYRQSCWWQGETKSK